MQTVNASITSDDSEQLESEKTITYISNLSFEVLWDYVVGLPIHLFLIVGDIVPHLITFSCPAVCSRKYVLLNLLI